MKPLARIRKKFGDFWWWSLCLFVAARSGDLINAFVGLWLVPKYVPQEELGAVLPLTQVTGALGLPLSVLVVTFTKFLNQYKTDGADGKVKALICAFWSFAVGAVVFGTFVSVWLMPHFFERIHVESGSLGLLIVLAAMLNTVNPVFSNALQALKRFKALTFIGLCMAPVRLMVMLVAMPFRALSGYMLGQAAPAAFGIACSVVCLRKDLRHDVRPEPFWREDWKEMLKFTMFVAVSLGYGTLFPAIQMTVVRQRLPELDSAAYYMISRFAEISMYVGSTMSFVLFPLVAESNAKGLREHGLVVKAVAASLVFGLACSACLWLAGGWLFGLLDAWRPYEPFVPDMALLAVTLTLGVCTANFVANETASGRFGFLLYTLPIVFSQTAFLVAFTGYEYFRGKLPDLWVDWMASCEMAHLRNVLWLFFAATFVIALCNAVHVFLRARRR